MAALENPPNDVPPPAKTIRELAHDLSNAIEIIMQSSFLLGTLDLGENGRQWHQLLDGGVEKATAINRQLREALRAEDRPETRVSGLPLKQPVQAALPGSPTRIIKKTGVARGDIDECSCRL